MSYTKTLATAVLIAGAFIATPAFAGTQDDVQSCREAITVQQPGILDGYRLRFKGQKGYKTPVISLEAIPNKKSAGERFKVTCRLNHKDQVMAVNTTKVTKFAKK